MPSPFGKGRGFYPLTRRHSMIFGGTAKGVHASACLHPRLGLVILNFTLWRHLARSAERRRPKMSTTVSSTRLLRVLATDCVCALVATAYGFFPDTPRSPRRNPPPLPPPTPSPTPPHNPRSNGHAQIAEKSTIAAPGGSYGSVSSSAARWYVAAPAAPDFLGHGRPKQQTDILHFLSPHLVK